VIYSAIFSTARLIKLSFTAAKAFFWWLLELFFFWLELQRILSQWGQIKIHVGRGRRLSMCSADLMTNVTILEFELVKLIDLFNNAEKHVFNAFACAG
jgi:hypothetical protein